MTNASPAKESSEAGSDDVDIELLSPGKRSAPTGLADDADVAAAAAADDDDDDDVDVDDDAAST